MTPPVATAEHTAGQTTETKHTPGPWEYVPSNQNHGPYVVNAWGSGDICDCYTMSNLSGASVFNGGDSKPIHFQHEEADANARLIAAAPDLLAALRAVDLARHTDAPADWEAATALSDAALSKAEGRQS